MGESSAEAVPHNFECMPLASPGVYQTLIHYLTTNSASYKILNCVSQAENGSERGPEMGGNKIMVCVTQQKSCERLIQAGMEYLADESDELHVIHVVKENWKYFGQLKEADALDYLFEVSKSHGASLTVKKATDIVESLSAFAEKNAIDHIVMGESLEPSAQQNMIKRLQKKTSKRMRFHIVPLEDQPSKVG